MQVVEGLRWPLVQRRLSQCFSLLFAVAVLLLGGCANLPPSNPNNLCDVFDDKSSWYKQARRAQNNWGSSIPVMMSIMYQESQFKHDARPARRKILWVIPGPRPSSAFGYPQAKNEVWGEYKKAVGSSWVRRDNFGDAIDFIGWYNKQSQRRNRIGLNDGYNLYLAYHEGQGGYSRASYRNKNWLVNTARRVDSRAKQYAAQLQGCEARLRRGGWWPF